MEIEDAIRRADSHNRLVARCSAFFTQVERHVGLGQMMIGSGWAIPHRLRTAERPKELAETYDALEFLARGSGLGIWANPVRRPPVDLFELEQKRRRYGPAAR